jgi:O-succinylbenzoic acid--CoA ligase
MIVKANLNPQDLFLKTTARQYSYKDLFLFAEHFSQEIKKRGLRNNQPIGLCGPSSDEMIFMIASCWLFNIPFTVFNHHLSGPKIEQQFRRIQPNLIITSEPERINHHQILSFDSFKPEDILYSSPHFEQSSFNSIMAERPLNEDYILGYFFTSGTSSTPKIVPLKRRQMIAAAKSSAKNISPSSDQCWLLCMPLFHIGGVSIILRSLLYGSGIFHLPIFDENEIAHRLSTDKSIVAISLVPTMLKRLAENPKLRIHDNLQAVLLGGGPVSKNLIAMCSQKSIPVITSFGMTETCAQIAANLLFKDSDSQKKHQSAGRIFKPNRAEVRNQRNQPVPTGISGSIWMKGPQVFDGYLEDPVKNMDNNRWFNTGDYGKLDEDGCLFIEARRTDLIITGGENVSPREVENVLEQLKPIKEAAVFGVSDEEWGQRIVAALVLTSSATINQKDLKNRLKEDLPSYKIPKEFLFVDELPHTHNGKLQRSKLKELVS